MDLIFTPAGKSAVLMIEGLPETRFILLDIAANREVYQAGVDDKGYIVHEQSETTRIILTVRNIETTKKL